LLEVPVIVVEEGPERAGRTDPKLLERLPEGTPVKVKKTFGLAGEPAALEAIDATQRKTVVLVGFQTNTCVAQSAIQLHDLGFRVVSVEDGMYASSAAKHERGLRRMQQAGVEAHDCFGITSEWARVVDVAFEVIEASKARWGE
jgi:nicotinamidase-related amidase